MYIDRKVKRNLRFRRTVSGITQEKAAEIAGMSISRYREYEDYKKPLKCVRTSRLLKLCKFYGISLNQLEEDVKDE